MHVCSARYPGRLPVRALLRRPKAYEIAGRSTEILKNTIAESLIKLPGMTIDLPPTVASVDASHLGAAAVSDQEKDGPGCCGCLQRGTLRNATQALVCAMASGVTGNLQVRTRTVS